eukprot:m.948032 g.948032  ORF g.948032 m.948032 type:complete len:60 (-) comp304276_c0_seq1:133-312(-)
MLVDGGRVFARLGGLRLRCTVFQMAAAVVVAAGLAVAFAAVARPHERGLSPARDSYCWS